MVAVIGASITLIGAKTMVHHNCTAGNSTNYGLEVHGSSSSTIQLVSPLTKEQVSIDNGGSGNWGATFGGADINQIKTIDAPVIASAAATAAPVGETKSQQESYRLICIAEEAMLRQSLQNNNNN